MVNRTFQTNKRFIVWKIIFLLLSSFVFCFFQKKTQEKRENLTNFFFRQNVQLISGKEENSRTYIDFVRALNTGDEQDHVIEPDKHGYLIWVSTEKIETRKGK